MNRIIEELENQEEIDLLMITIDDMNTMQPVVVMLFQDGWEVGKYKTYKRIVITSNHSFEGN